MQLSSEISISSFLKLAMDYQIPVTQREMDICKQQSEIKMRHLPAVDRFKRYGR